MTGHARTAAATGRWPIVLGPGPRGFPSPITARHRLAVLVRLGMLRRFRPQRETGSAPWHYVLGPIGTALLGVEDRDERKWARTCGLTGSCPWNAPSGSAT